MVALTITVNNEKSEARIIKKMHERVIKSFMDTIIMAELQNGRHKRIRRNIIHPHKIWLPSKLRHSLLTALLTGTQRLSRRRLD